MGYQFLNFVSLPSTSDYIKKNYLSLPSKTVVATQNQTLGHGRLGRSWSGGLDSATFSLLLKGDEYVSSLPLLPIATGEAVALALEKHGVKPMLKWPNDVYINGKKVAGILLEGLYEGNEFLGVVLGIGINLNNREFPPELDNATSLYLCTRRIHEAGTIVKEVLDELEPKLTCPETSLDYFSSHDFLLGKEICLNYYGENLKGIARGIDKQGRLLLETNGAIKTVSSGEASLHPKDKK